MQDFVDDLPPLNVQGVKYVKKDLQEYLELEAKYINLVTTTDKFNLYSGKVLKSENIQVGKETKQYFNDTNVIIYNNNYINSASVNEICKDLWLNVQDNEVQEKGNASRKNLIDSVQVRILWRSECVDDTANISISCIAQQPKLNTEHFKLKTKNKYLYKKKHNQKHDQKYKHQQTRRQNLPLSANKLRYRVCMNGALFLEYLRSCKLIKIIVTGSSGRSLRRAKPLGKAEFNIPLVYLKKFNHNIKDYNFIYKTQLHTLNNQIQESVLKTIVKSGEIQLRFKMLFAPTVAASATAVAATQHANVVMHDKHIHGNHYHQLHRNHHRLGGKSAKVSEDIHGDIPKRLTSHTKSEEIVEAMKKLDAKLVAYLAGKTELSSKLSNCEEENEVNLNLENKHISNHFEDLLPATKFNIFKTINGIKLEMEALTLQTEGTQFINLLKNEIEPIFTVECQLSNELIKLVPRHDMFHIMQFESEKFQSLTQCTRFAQKAERAIKLDVNADWSDENANETVPDFGRIHFTVWWREPGTCLNEMLGMGILELNDLYNASLLEQCKRIEIKRRDKHLACLYLKVILQRDALKSATQIILVDSDSEKSPTTDKNKNNAMGQQQISQCGIQANTATNGGHSGTDKGEYGDNFLYLKHTKIQ